MKRTFHFCFVLFAASSALALAAEPDKAAQLASFELVWNAVRDHNPDPKLNGLDWQAIHATFRPRIEHAKSLPEVRGILREMIGKLGVSHYAIIPGDLYSAVGDAPANPDSTAGIDTVILDGKVVVKSVTPDSPAAQAGVEAGMVLDGINGAKVAPLLDTTAALPDTEASRLAARAVTRQLAGSADSRIGLDLLDADGHSKHVELARTDAGGKTVEFGNLPGVRLKFESRTLPSGAGYIRFNEFLDPVTLIPRFAAALETFAHAPGVILDLRGNRGGMGVMAMGIEK